MRRVVLFTGGSASNLLARSLEAAGIAATHVVSVFDNGGSTGELRRIADLPAMGDIRNRLCALASCATPEAIRLRSLFLHRLAKNESATRLGEELDALCAGNHHLTTDLHPRCRQEVLDALSLARAALPPGFALALTSVGNLLILGRCQQARSFLGALDWAANLLDVRSRVLPVTLESVHLGAELDDGQWLIGQAALTSEGRTADRRISRLALLLGEDSSSEPEREVDACPQVLEAIMTADAIVFGFGSFYSSVLPHLLVSGVADAIDRRPVPRILLANPTADRETERMTVEDIVRIVTARAISTRREQSPFLTHVIHFSGVTDLAIPTGDLSRFIDSGGEVLSESDPMSLEAVADRATSRMVSILPVPKIAGRDSPEAGYPVVLLDLDHTLLDYGSLRRGAAVTALSTFCQTPDVTCDLLLEHLVTPTTYVLREYGFPDLRREWNCPAFFAWAALLDDPDLRQRALQALREIRTAGDLVAATSPFEARSRFHALAGAPGESAGWPELATEALRLATDGDHAFSTQVAAFDTYVAANAELLPGAHALLEDLAGDDVPAIIVTEGNSSVQRAKIEYLGLDDLVTSAVVADRTLGVIDLVEEIFLHSTRLRGLSPHLGATYDELSRFVVKTPSFYGKFVHSLVAFGPRGLEAAIEDAALLTEEEWAGETRPRLAAVGDRYGKDLQPLLVACPEGATAFRLLQGKYAAEFPLHEIRAKGLPVPQGQFEGLTAARSALLAWARADGPEVSRPKLMLDRSTLEAFADSADYLSPAAVRTLTKINAELGRHPQ